jgi:hypothetical protein
MTRLSDTQAVILSAASQRPDRNVLPLPGSLRGGAAAKVVGALLSRGLIAESTTDSRTKADAALNRIWRNDADGHAVLLHITDAGLAALGIEPDRHRQRGAIRRGEPVGGDEFGFRLDRGEGQKPMPVDQRLSGVECLQPIAGHRELRRQPPARAERRSLVRDRGVGRRIGKRCRSEQHIPVHLTRLPVARSGARSEPSGRTPARIPWPAARRG